ncbi:tyrosine-type recombinase/integrase [Halorubrum salsamenti]|uniref:tyrosine-type recombinase/integrase n=1 Tax=Halorubrum salsamenti TaxID=2583990 RepID=UPI0011A8B187|nr:site-specific integrase [Halorubrum salsamenti]
MPTNTLEPIGPRDAYELYLADCEGELSPNTVEAKKYRLGFFVRWSEGKDNDGEARIINLNRLSGRDLLRYKNWRQDRINTVTLKTQLSELREFLRFCVSIDAVEETLPEKVTVPSLEPGENVRETFMDPDEATTILQYLEQYHYASLDHVLMLLLWQTGARVAGIHSLDIGDIDTDEETLALRHRPDQGTRLKNGEEGERIVAVPAETIAVVEDFIDAKRPSVTDEYGREPLLATTNGRIHKRHLSKHVYKWSCPCQYNQPCPADKDPMECEYTGGYDSSVECPHNTRPHDIRRGAITHWLKRDVPDRAISDRMNVSVATLDRHYDARSEEERAEQRRQYLSDVQATDRE